MLHKMRGWLLLQGEALKIVKEAVVVHLRTFVVDHSLVPLFEKKVSFCCLKLILV